jgi:hypothetical protein
MLIHIRNMHELDFYLDCSYSKPYFMLQFTSYLYVENKRYLLLHTIILCIITFYSTLKDLTLQINQLG